MLGDSLVEASCYIIQCACCNMKQHANLAVQTELNVRVHPCVCTHMTYIYIYIQHIYIYTQVARMPRLIQPDISHESLDDEQVSK